MKSKFVVLLALPLLLSLSACGDTWGERAVTGGGIGAGTGLAIGAIAGWPLLAPALAGAAGFFDDAGYPTGTGWDELLFPELADPHAYALMVSGDSMEPVYRDGDGNCCPSAGEGEGNYVLSGAPRFDTPSKTWKHSFRITPGPWRRRPAQP